MSNLVAFPAGGSLTERVAEEVRALMGRHQVRQVDLARVLNVTQPQVSLRLRGKVEFTLEDIENLARFFGVSPASLLGGMSLAPPTGPGVSMATQRYANYIAA